LNNFFHSVFILSQSPKQSNPEEAYRIKNKYSAYLKKQSRRLAKSRQMKNKEQIENLMKFIDKKLSKSNS